MAPSSLPEPPAAEAYGSGRLSQASKDQPLAVKLNEEMKLAAACALAEVIPEEELSEDYVIPSLFDERIVPTMAEAVAEAARESGSARTSLEEEHSSGTHSQA
jgi:malic enzyme